MNVTKYSEDKKVSTEKKLLHDADPNQRPGKETKDESGRSDAKTSNATNKRPKGQRSMKHKGEQRRGKRKKRKFLPQSEMTQQKAGVTKSEQYQAETTATKRAETSNEKE